jgi:hypothetical protein
VRENPCSFGIARQFFLKLEFASAHARRCAGATKFHQSSEYQSNTVDNARSKCVIWAGLWKTCAQIVSQGVPASKIS